MFVKDLVKEFVFDCEIRKLSSRTTTTYRENITQLFNYVENEWGVTELENITSMQIKKFFQYLIAKRLSESYCNTILKSLRAFYKYCLQEEYILKNPCEKVPWQKQPKTIIKAFNDEEIVKMLKSYNTSSFLDVRNRALIAFLVDTGARSLETCLLRNQDISEMFITIKGKGNKERYVAVTPYLKKYMIKHERVKEFYFKNKKVGYDNYFLSRTGRPLTVEALEVIVRKAGEIAGVRDEIRCSPHTIRHYHAQTQIKNGLDVYSLSRLLGHESISITKRYLQSMNDEDIVRMSVKTSPLMNLK